MYPAPRHAVWQPRLGLGHEYLVHNLRTGRDRSGPCLHLLALTRRDLRVLGHRHLQLYREIDISFEHPEYCRVSHRTPGVFIRQRRDLAVFYLGTAYHLAALSIIRRIAEVVRNHSKNSRYIGKVPVCKKTDLAVRQRLEIINAHRHHAAPWRHRPCPCAG